MLFFEPDGTIAWVSPASRRLFGIDPTELVGVSGFALIHPDDHERVFTDLAGMPNLGDHVRTEFRIQHRDGRLLWVEEIATNLIDDPSVGVIVGNLRDITDRKVAEEQLRLQSSILAAAGQAIVAFDIETTVIYWNSAAEATYGWSADEAIGQASAKVLPMAGEWRASAAAIRAALTRGETWSGTLQFCKKDGDEIPVHVAYTRVLDERGAHVATIGVSSDISERVAMLRQIEEDRRRLAESQASAHLGSWEVDLATGALARSEELFRIIGRSPQEDIGFDLDHVHADDREALADLFGDVMGGRRRAAEHTHRVVRPDGEVRWVLSRASVDQRSGSPVMSGTVLDITERYDAQMKLAYQASHDLLTGLPNRSALTERVRDLLADRTPEHHVAVALLDLDQFKVINDTLGHETGDVVLRAVADRLRQELPATDLVGRFGGDEFVLVRPSVRTYDDARALGVAAAQALQTPVEAAGRRFELTASVGVTLSGEADSPASLVRDADVAMYQAKQDGRARIATFEGTARLRAQRNLALEAGLRVALHEEQFHLVFQPVLDLATVETVGLESLLRWDHPELGAVSPAEFIPIAE